MLGVIKLRITRPDLPRPYRAWGYPVTPVIFLLVTLFMMYYLVVDRPLQSFFGALIMVSGLLIYAVFRKKDDSGPAIAIAHSPRRSQIECFGLSKLAAAAASSMLATAHLAAARADDRHA